MFLRHSENSFSDFWAKNLVEQQISLLHEVFYFIGNFVITPRRLVELKKNQRYNRREDGRGHCPLFLYIQLMLFLKPYRDRCASVKLARYRYLCVVVCGCVLYDRKTESCASDRF